MYLVPNIHPGSGSAGVPTVQANFAVPLSDWTTVSTLSSMPSGGSISRSGQAMLYDSTGKLTYAPNNLALQSQTLNNASWTLSNILAFGSGSVADATTAPDGTTTADKIVEDTALAYHYVYPSLINVISGQSYVMSIYAKAVERSFLQIVGSGGFGANAFANFDLSTGVLGTVGSTATASILSVGNGWYRCTIAATATATTTLALAYAIVSSATSARFGTYTGDGTSGLYLWGAQAEAVTYQTTPSTYVATTSAAYYGPRFDYNPSTLAAKGLLIEGTRTNLLTYSEQFDNAAWTKNGSTVTANNTTSPDGTSNADKLIETATTGIHALLFTGTTVAASTTSSISLYVKSAERTRIRLSLVDATTGVDYCQADFNLSAVTSTVTNAGLGSGAIASITAINNSWYRIVLTGKPSTSSNNTRCDIYLLNASGVASYTGDGTSGAFIYGAQLEAASFPSSYIPTVAASVARAAETFAITGYSSSLINAYYTDEATGGSYSLPYNAGTAPSPSFAWLTSLRPYTNAYAGSIASPSWLSFSRSGNATMTDSTGALTFAPNNLLLNTATLSTQTVTTGIIPSCDVILSFKGTGSVAISGGYTGTLAGTGASNLVSLKFTTTTASLTFTVTGTVTEAQLERVTYETQPSLYVANTSSQYYGPRYDFDASTVPATPRGLLIEESRTNLLTYSEQFNDASWTKSNSTITANATTAPDGTTTADKLVEDTAASVAHYTSKTVSVTVAAHTYSVYAKAGERNWIRLLAFQSSLSGVEAYFNLSTGTIGTVGASATAIITNVGNGWYRCSMTYTPVSAATCTHYIYVTTANNVSSYTGDGVSGVYIWGAQLEAGSFATSYIPTVAASVTRAADAAQLTGSALTVAGANTGTAIVQTTAWLDATSATRYLLASSGSRRMMYSSGSNNTIAAYDGTNVFSAALGSGTFTGNPVRFALGWASPGGSLVANNGVVGTSSTISLGTGANVYLGGASIAPVGGFWFASMAFYGTRLPDAILKQKSSVGAPY